MCISLVRFLILLRMQLPIDAEPPAPEALPAPPLSWTSSKKASSTTAPDVSDPGLSELLEQLNRSMQLVSARPRKLLVLDLNGLLCWRVRKGKLDMSSIPHAPDASVGQFHAFLRPHLFDFLSWCMAHFHVVVWSTATARNLAPMVELAFGGIGAPAFVLDQSDCTDTGERHPGAEHTIMLKELSHLWSRPTLGNFDASNTVLIDDSPYKALTNPEFTAIHPRAWQGPSDADAHSHAALEPAGELRRTLEAINVADDARTVVAELHRRIEADTREYPDGWMKASSCPISRLLRERGWSAIQ